MASTSVKVWSVSDKGEANTLLKTIPYATYGIAYVYTVAISKNLKPSLASIKMRIIEKRQ